MSEEQHGMNIEVRYAKGGELPNLTEAKRHLAHFALALGLSPALEVTTTDEETETVIRFTVAGAAA